MSSEEFLGIFSRFLLKFNVRNLSARHDYYQLASRSIWWSSLFILTLHISFRISATIQWVYTVHFYYYFVNPFIFNK